MVVVEMSVLDTHGVHQLLSRMMVSDDKLIVAVIGDHVSVGQAAASIQQWIHRESLKSVMIRIYHPKPNIHPWVFDEMQLVLLSRSWPKFKV